MTNDAKLGMVAGVAGVIVAAALWSGAPTQTAQPKPGAADPPAKEKLGQHAQPPPGPGPTAAATPAGSPAEAHAALPSTPVPRTRKDVDGQPASRPSGMEEEP